MTYEAPTYPKGDIRRALVLAALIDVLPAPRQKDLLKQTGYNPRVFHPYLEQLRTELGMEIEINDEKGYEIISWGPILKASGVRALLAK